MPDKRPLSDTAVHDRLVAAAEALGEAPGATIRGNTVLATAREALMTLQLGLVDAMERHADRVLSINYGEPQARPRRRRRSS